MCSILLFMEAKHTHCNSNTKTAWGSSQTMWVEKVERVIDGNPVHITALHLALSVSPFYLPREHFLLQYWHIFPPFQTCDVLTQLQTLHPRSICLLQATPETVKRWIYFMPATRRHITHNPSLLWVDLITPRCFS